MVDAGLHEDKRFMRYLLGGLVILYFGLVKLMFRFVGGGVCSAARCLRARARVRRGNVCAWAAMAFAARSWVHMLTLCVLLCPAGTAPTPPTTRPRYEPRGEWVRRPKPRLPGQMADLRAELGDRELLAGKSSDDAPCVQQQLGLPLGVAWPQTFCHHTSHITPWPATRCRRGRHGRRPLVPPGAPGGAAAV